MIIPTNPLSIPRQLSRQLPLLLVRNSSRIPFAIRRLLAEKIFKTVFKEAMQEGDFDFLNGKTIKIEIKDANINWYFSKQDKKITIEKYAKESASISGNLKEFILLSARREDPDTLFFQRRLMIQGDTEVGLQMKNLLDTLDPECLPFALEKTIQLAADIVDADEQNTGR